jgi:hypothetical protein
MTNIEKRISEYYYAVQRNKWRELDLIKLREAYKAELEGQYPHSAEIKVQNTNISSPVERATIVLVDKYNTEISALEASVKSDAATIAAIRFFVESAGLTGRQMEYVRRRYFEKQSVQMIMREMYISQATATNIRAGALSRLQEADRADAQQRQTNTQTGASVACARLAADGATN